MVLVTLVGVGRHREALGVVVDLCPQCAGLQPHWLCDNYAALEVHHVRLDSGLYADSSTVCFRCSSEVEVVRSSYSAILPQDVAARIGIDEGLERTNRKLSRALRAVSNARVAGVPNETLERAESILFTRRDIGEHFDALDTWSSLESTEQERVAKTIESLWRAAASRTLPTVPIQPGMPGWMTPIREPSIWRALDRKVVLVALVVAGGILALAIGGSILFD